MTDHFATLALPRRPWLEPAAVKEAFHRIGAAQHPDATGGGDAAAFAAVNAAWQVLREPAARLRHLLDLEGRAGPEIHRPIPPPLADFFMELAGLRRALEDFRRRESAATGALAEALLAGDRRRLAGRFGEAADWVEALLERALEEVRGLDAQWSGRGAGMLDRLRELQEELAFVTKWRQQLREGLFQLGA